MVTPGSGFSVSETVPSGWVLDSATCSDGSPISNIDVSPGGDRDVHVHQPQTGGSARRRQGRGPELLVRGLQLHRRRRTQPDLVPTRRRRQQLDTLSNTRTFSDLVAGRRLFDRRDGPPEGWEQVSATCSDGSPVLEYRRRRRARRSRALSTNRKARHHPGDQGRAARRSPRTSGSTPVRGLSPSTFLLDDDGTDAEPPFQNIRKFPGSSTRQLLGQRKSFPRAGTPSSRRPATTAPSPSNINLSAGRGGASASSSTGGAPASPWCRTRCPDGPQDFAYTAGGGLSPTSFQLDDDGAEANPLSSSRHVLESECRDLLDLAGDPTPAGSLEDSICSDGSPFLSINVSRRRTGHVHVPAARSAPRSWCKRTRDPTTSRTSSSRTGGGITPIQFLARRRLTRPAYRRTLAALIVDPGSGYSVRRVLTRQPLDAGIRRLQRRLSHLSNIDVVAGETVTCTFVNIA